MQKKYIRNIIILFCLGWAMVYADRTALYPMLSIIGREYNLNSTQIGVINSTYLLTYLVLQIPAGSIGDRVGLKRVLVIFYIIAGISLLLIGLFTTSYLTILFFAALHGIGAGAYYPCAYGITMNTVPDKSRGLSSAIINSGMSIGLIIGLLSSGPLYTLTGNWRSPFLLLAIPTLILALFYQFVLDDVQPIDKTQFDFKSIFKNKNLMLLNFVTFCSLYGFWVALTWGPSFFESERGVSITLAGVYTAIPAFIAIPVSVHLARLSDYIGRKKITLIILPLAALSIIMMAYIQSTLGLIITLITYGICGKLTLDPIAISWYTDHVSNTNIGLLGSAIGVFNFFSILSGVVASTLSGLIKDITGSLVGAFYLGAIIVFLGFIAAIFVEE